MKMIHTELPEVLILEYDLMMDKRGEKHSVYREKELEEAGIQFHMVSEMTYYPKKTGTLYGIHFQNNPKPQAKIMSCEQGAGIDYSVDLRKSSPNYKKWVGIPLEANPRRQIYIPEGFGHVFLSLEEDTIVHMKINQEFDDRYSRQIAWNDPEIAIDYPIRPQVLALYDMVAPALAESDCNL